jgi:thioredoxin 1
VEWMKKVIEVQPISFNLDTYAALLYKTGDLEEADNYADQAIEAAKKEGQDYSSTKELKEKIRKAKKEK